MKKNILKLITFFSCCILQGCTALYIPNSQNVPIMEEKGQINISLAENLSEDNFGIEFQTAFGLSNNIALQFNADWSNFSSSRTEIGLGYYKKFNNHFVFENYGLIALGNFNYSASEYHQARKANFLRAGMQPSISFSTKYFSTSLSGRLANLSYNNISASEELDNLRANNSYWLLEPAFTIQAGSENVKFQFQFLHSFNLTNSNFPQNTDLFSIGIKSNFNSLNSSHKKFN